MIYCSNCNEELVSESLFCNKCGAKVINEKNLNDSDDSDVYAEKSLIEIPKETKKKSKMKKIFIFALVGILILASAGSGYWYYTDKQSKAALAQALEYRENLGNAVLRMMGFAIVSEQVCDLYSDVWNRSIKSSYGITVNGKKAYDFNEALRYEREALSDKNILKGISDNTKEVDTLMQKLNTPPIEYQKAYDFLIELYGSYTQLTDQANSPSGSLVEFNKKINQLSSDFSKTYNQFKVLLPSLDESKINDFVSEGLGT